jgi:glycosyltransferase involved in cell wall biosynthesis
MGNEATEVAQARIVSVTIPMYNKEIALSFVLKSVFKQTYPFIEVIVVDSHSSDKTKDIAFGV